MNEKDRIEFRKMLAAYMDMCSKSGNDQHAVLAGVVAMEAWIDQLVGREVGKLVRQSSKLRLS